MVYLHKNKETKQNYFSGMVFFSLWNVTPTFPDTIIPLQQKWSPMATKKAKRKSEKKQPIWLTVKRALILSLTKSLRSISRCILCGLLPSNATVVSVGATLQIYLFYHIDVKITNLSTYFPVFNFKRHYKCNWLVVAYFCALREAAVISCLLINF